MKNPPRFSPVGPHWTSNLDRRFFEEHYGPDEHYEVAAMRILNTAVAEFDRALNRAYAKLFETEGLERYVGESHTPGEKIEILIASQRSLDPDVLAEKLLDDLTCCQWADGLRRLCLEELREDPLEGVWPADILTVASTLTKSASQMEGTLAEHFPDYLAQRGIASKSQQRDIPEARYE